MKTPIAVLGASGRMGRRVVALSLASEDVELVAAIGRPGSAAIGVDAGLLAGAGPCGVAVAPLDAGFGRARVVVDFSLPAGTRAALSALGDRALVSGATGLDADGLDAIAAHGSSGPVLHAANFSPGVNLLLALAARAASALPAADAEIVEAHHAGKLDAPSGTALAIADAVASARGVSLADGRRDGRSGRTGPRPPGEIGLHALRAGGIVGHHELWLATPDEQLVLTHTAGSRDVFARGALRAARWIADRPPGIYRMAQVLGLEDLEGPTA